jgi:hypothetical protein
MRSCIFAHESDGNRLSLWQTGGDSFEANVRGERVKMTREEFYRMASTAIATLYDLPGVPGPQKQDWQNENNDGLGKDVRPYAADSD